MGNIGQLNANNFLVPQMQMNPANVAASSTSSTPNFDIPDPEEGLALIQGIDGDTKSYYDKWAKVKQFAQAMQSKFGIDVTRPDVNNQGSVKANEIFNKAIADLKFQGDRLKTTQKMLESRLANQAAGQGIMTGSVEDAYTSNEGAAQMFTSTKANDLVNAFNQQLGKTLHTSNDLSRANDIYDAAYARLTEIAAEDPQNERYWLLQRDMLKKPLKTDVIQQESSTSKTAKIKQQSALELAKKVSHLITGTGAGWKQGKVKGESGNYMLENTSDYTGIKYGDKNITAWYKDPTSGQVYLSLQSGNGDELVPVSREDALGVMRQIVSDNAKFGLQSGLDGILAEMGLIDDRGELDPGQLLDPSAVEEGATRDKEALSYTENVEALKADVDSLLSSKSSTVFGRDIAEFDLGKNKLKFSQNIIGDNFTITPETLEAIGTMYGVEKNSKESTVSYRKRVAKMLNIEDVEDITKDEIISLLDDVGYFNEAYDKSSKDSGTNSGGFDPGAY